MSSDKQLDKARAAVKKKNYEYAAELYLLHLKATPGDIEARAELRAAQRAQKKVSGGGGWSQKLKVKKLEAQASMIRVSKKDPEKTMIACEELLKQDPDLPLALLRLGESASYANLNEVAVHVFEDLLGVDRENKEGLRLLGRVFEGTDELEKALKCFQRLSKLDPKDGEALEKVKKIPAAITSKGFQKGMEKGGFKGLIDQDEAAKLERNTQRVRTPEQALARISELEAELGDPPDGKVLRQIAELYVKAEQPDEAIKACERALELDAHDFAAGELRGDLLLAKYDGAIKQLEHAYRKAPDDQVKKKLIKTKKEKRRFEIDEYSRRADAHPTEPGLRLPLGKALYDEGRIDEAIEALQKAKLDARKKSEAAHYLGQCYIKKKIYKLALKELDGARAEMFEMDALKKEITYLIGRIYENAGPGHKDKALAEYEKIAEVDFNFKDVTKRIESLSTI